MTIDLLRALVLSIYPEHQILRAGADADFRAPDAQAGADVVASVATGVMAPGFLEHGIGDPGNRPELAAMGMSAELEIHSGLLGFLQMEGLMVQQITASRPQALS